MTDSGLLTQEKKVSSASCVVSFTLSWCCLLAALSTARFLTGMSRKEIKAFSLILSGWWSLLCLHPTWMCKYGVQVYQKKRGPCLSGHSFANFRKSRNGDKNALSHAVPRRLWTSPCAQLWTVHLKMRLFSIIIGAWALELVLIPWLSMTLEQSLS